MCYNSAYEYGNEIVHEMKKLTIEDVTLEYTGNANPKIGVLRREDGFKEKDHSNEINVAEFLFNTFGGEIVLLKETIEDENPDYRWNNRLWDLKSPNGTGNLGKLLKKGLSQIFKNPGGIVLDISSLKTDTTRIEHIITERMQTSLKHSVDVMIIRRNKLIKVLRYKK